MAKNGQKRPFLRVFRVIFKVVAKNPLFFLISFKNYVIIIYRLREIFDQMATNNFDATNSVIDIYDSRKKHALL